MDDDMRSNEIIFYPRTKEDHGGSPSCPSSGIESDFETYRDRREAKRNAGAYFSGECPGQRIGRLVRSYSNYQLYHDIAVETKVEIFVWGPNSSPASPKCLVEQNPGWFEGGRSQKEYRENTCIILPMRIGFWIHRRQEKSGAYRY